MTPHRVQKIELEARQMIVSLYSLITCAGKSLSLRLTTEDERCFKKFGVMATPEPPCCGTSIGVCDPGTSVTSGTVSAVEIDRDEAFLISDSSSAIESTSESSSSIDGWSYLL
ncbi:hypothetical protein OGAPHI_003640 [Ogataea philodendri]|uniref:Uncharacterized protein n=1 Tax=Ogataea philodendri TaxID=1378263 RepID=A0A9P8P5K4_9ASCO|nr:uncharacterized protein OGAPHI_003640 [Ogataea philodendri]KAH3665456.1 hypothetical protein OGAPHI_003640 [Ogataea philodendri]